VNTATADLWFAWVGEHVADVDAFSREYLSRDESARLPEYRVREAAERYVVTRSLVRIVLSEHLGVAPKEIRVSRTDTGKPILTDGIHFNVTHSADLILLAVSDSRPVGVDVERRRAISRVDALTRRWLSESEQRALERLRRSGVTESDAFLRIWSLKEAQLKALGVGISGASSAPLHLVEVRPLDDLLGSLAHDGGDPGYVGALAFA
jgi:4'-phosphopantetheinyl transferase